MTTVVVTSYFEEEYIRRIREVDERLRVLYREDLVPPPRWPGDHAGPEEWERTPENEEEFLSMLSEAEVLYDFPRGHVNDLAEAAPGLQWVQGSMAGAGEVAQKAGLQDTDVVVTTASGIYSGPLAEFVLMAMLQHAKDLDHLRSDKAGRIWRQGAVGTLENKTLCVVGMGSIGRAIAGLARPFGMRIVGVKRTVREVDEAWEYADELYPTAELRSALGEADYVAVTLPGTPETQRLIDAEALAATRQGAYFANVGRGSVVDERSLVEALESGHLSGAALDVFEVEPLPEESSLWELDNVIVSAHTTDVVPELINAAQTDLFCENLRRYLAGEELLNVLDKRLLY
ncbi:MAG: D-3-phosphoglycerate dehydrogenase [uncultured Rubrobacteraceae bacterium]|uniref:D-3-phosphoglycerate dehydrogenase n=1 Tax=uncultured Rubrobacteraceae bacterium TaxID=349277 RepID=A0A6J4QER7_9ACTN|nr:MAG: D-3-phosphoglycerate dehydrogenase [uncultured Rubrobacteraceae bacterium]